MVVVVFMNLSYNLDMFMIARVTQGLERQARSAHAAGLLSTEELERAVSGQSKMFPSGIPECGADALRFTLCSHNIKSKSLRCCRCQR